MITYTALFIYIIIIGIIIFRKKADDEKVENNNKKIFLAMAGIPMIFIMGFRDVCVGTDTNLYAYIFSINSQKSIMELFNSLDNSPLYTLYNIILGDICKNTQAIILVNSIIIISLFSRFVYKNSKHVVISTILFFEFYHFFAAFNITRQYIAMLIVANALSFLNKKDIWKYIFFCICATMIHTTSIIALILVPFTFFNGKLKNKLEIIYVFAMVIVFIFFKEFFSVFAKIFPHYSMYTNLLTVSKNRKGIITFIYIVFSIYYYYLKKNKKLNKDEMLEFDKYNLINVTGIIFGIMSLKLDLLTRISYYFTFPIIIYAPMLIDKIENSKYRSVVYIAFLGVMLIPMYILLRENNSEVLPYINILLN